MARAFMTLSRLENAFQEGDASGETEIEASWKAEAKRRVADSDAGTGATFSWEEVEAPLRARLAGLSESSLGIKLAPGVICSSWCAMRPRRRA